MPTHNGSSKSKPTDEELGRYHRRSAALNSRVLSGDIEYEKVMEVFQGLLDSRVLRTFSLLPSPLAQLKTAKMLNTLCGWGFCDSDFNFRSWPVNIPFEDRAQNLKHTQAVVLDIGLGTFWNTFKVVWSIIRASQLEVGGSVTETVRLVCPEHNFCNGLTWRVLDFGTHTDATPVKSVREGNKLLPASAVFWALVYNPKLLEHLQDFDIYKVWLGGCRIDGGDPDVPVLGFDQQSKRLEFTTGHSGNESPKRTIPEFVTSRIG